MAAVEVHGRESLGFLIGHTDRQFVGGRTGVEFDNLAARKRAEDTVRAVGFDIVGGSHSHPNGAPKISFEDVEVILDELEGVYSKM